MADLYIPVPEAIVKPDGLMTRALQLFLQKLMQMIVQGLALINLGIVGTVVLFDDLPADPVEGQFANISDGDTAVWGAVVGGSGANHVAVRWNGTDWTVTGA